MGGLSFRLIHSLRKLAIIQMTRQVNANHRSLADLGIDADLSTRLFGKAVNHRQAKTGALPDRLGGEERIKSAGDDIGRHAGAGVTDAEGNILTAAQAVFACAARIDPAI